MSLNIVYRHFITQGLSNGTCKEPLQDVTSNGAKKPRLDNNKPTLIWHVHNREEFNPVTLYRPHDVTFLDEQIILNDGFWPQSRIQVFDMKGACVRTIAHGDILPFGLCINHQKQIVITDHDELTVKIYTKEGDLVTTWDRDQFDWPDGIAQNKEGQYIVVDSARGHIYIHDSNGKRIREITEKTINVKNFSPKFVAIDSKQRIVVTDTHNNCIQVFAATGEYLMKIETDKEGQLSAPRGIAVDRQDNILVADWQANRISQFSPDGKFVQHLLTSADGLKHPWGLSTRRDGYLAISEQKVNSTPGLKLFSYYP